MTCSLIVARKVRHRPGAELAHAELAALRGQLQHRSPVFRVCPARIPQGNSGKQAVLQANTSCLMLAALYAGVPPEGSKPPPRQPHIQGRHQQATNGWAGVQPAHCCCPTACAPARGPQRRCLPPQVSSPCETAPYHLPSLPPLPVACNCAPPPCIPPNSPSQAASSPSAAASQTCCSKKTSADLAC